jgi:hypothetical protein
MIPMMAVIGIIVLAIVAIVAWSLLRNRGAPGVDAQHPARAVPGEGSAVTRPSPPAGTPATAPGK